MRIGTVGSGIIVANFIAAARQVPNVEIAAAYSRTVERSGAFASEHGIPHTYTDKSEFLAADLDFVYIASPNSLHFNWVKESLLAGKNVICEKPLTSTFKEAAELSLLAKENGLLLFEAMTVLHLPNLKLVEEKLSEIGRIKFAQLNFSQYSSRYAAFTKGNNPNIFNPEYSGGALMDLGCYNIAVLTQLFGPPRDLSYHANLADNCIDTSGILVFAYDQFHASAIAAKDSRSKNFIQIQGEDGYIYVEGASSRCAEFALFLNSGEQERFNLQRDKDALYFEIAGFKDIFDAKDFGKQEAFLNKTLTNMKLLDQARKSAGIVFPADK